MELNDAEVVGAVCQQQHSLLQPMGCPDNVWVHTPYMEIRASVQCNSHRASCSCSCRIKVCRLQNTVDYMQDYMWFAERGQHCPAGAVLIWFCQTTQGGYSLDYLHGIWVHTTNYSSSWVTISNYPLHVSIGSITHSPHGGCLSAQHTPLLSSPPFPSYQIMLRCWNQDAKKRPRMAAIHKQLESSILTNHYAPSWQLLITH